MEIRTKSHFVICDCYSDDHIIKFYYDSGVDIGTTPEIYISVQLNNHDNFFKRAWAGLKYMFGYECKYGHWDNCVMSGENAKNLRDYLNLIVKEYDKSIEEYNERANN